jgi:hypothetical protein
LTAGIKDLEPTFFAARFSLHTLVEGLLLLLLLRLVRTLAHEDLSTARRSTPLEQ